MTTLPVQPGGGEEEEVLPEDVEAPTNPELFLSLDAEQTAIRLRALCASTQLRDNPGSETRTIELPDGGFLQVTGIQPADSDELEMSQYIGSKETLCDNEFPDGVIGHELGTVEHPDHKEGVDAIIRVARQAQKLRDDLGITRSMAILDIGAGTGVSTSPIATAMNRAGVIAVETDAQYHAFLRARAGRDLKVRMRNGIEIKIPRLPHNVTALHANILDVNVPSGVEGIYMSYAFHHLSDDAKVLRTPMMRQWLMQKWLEDQRTAPFLVISDEMLGTCLPVTFNEYRYATEAMHGAIMDQIERRKSARLHDGTQKGSEFRQVLSYLLANEGDSKDTGISASHDLERSLEVLGAGRGMYTPPVARVMQKLQLNVPMDLRGGEHKVSIPEFVEIMQHAGLEVVEMKILGVDGRADQTPYSAGTTVALCQLPEQIAHNGVKYSLGF